MYSRIVLVALVLVMAANFALTDRSWKLASLPRMRELATLQSGPALAEFVAATQASGDRLDYPPRAAPRAPAPGAPPLKAGIAYREVTLFGMPLWAYPEPGLVTYYERPDHMQVLVIPPDERATLDEATGMAYSQVRFPWYFHLWGWILPLLILLWTKARAVDIRRAEEEELRRGAAQADERSA